MAFGGAGWQFAKLELATAGVEWSALLAVLGKKNIANGKARVATPVRMCDVQKAIDELNTEIFGMRWLAPFNVIWTVQIRRPYMALAV